MVHVVFRVSWWDGLEDGQGVCRKIMDILRESPEQKL